MHIRELFNLAGKVAVVTGGSRGLGKEMAIALGEAGARIVINARREQWLTPTYEELTAKGIECLALQTDVSKPEEIARLTEETIKKWGQIDILVNNAGSTWGSPPEDMPIDKWNSVLEVNATGTLLCCQIIGKEMMKRGRGNIINVSSTTGMLAVDPRVMQAIGYQASKAAIIAITKQLAIEWAKHNIRVNAIAPYFFATRLVEGVIAKAEKEMTEHVPMGRLGEDKELKGVVVFLASEASSYITGQVIVIDGGFTAW